MRSLLHLLFAAALATAAVCAKPNFAGTWELDKAASDFTKSRPVASITESITHQEPKITVDRMVRYSQGESHQIWRLNTNGSEQWQTIPEGSLGTKTRWDGDKLITEVTDDSGNHVMREVRELDSQGRMTVLTTYQSEEGPGEARAVYVKK